MIHITEREYHGYYVGIHVACMHHAVSMCHVPTPNSSTRATEVLLFFSSSICQKKKEERRVSLPCGTIIIMRAHFNVILSIFDLLMQCIHIIFDEFPKLLPILLFYDSEYAYTMQGPRNSEKVEHPPNTH